MAPRGGRGAGGARPDREILFDLPYSYLRLHSGEKIFDRIESIEDTKGNSGVKGRMVITNLRIIWHAITSPRINMSIGLNCILTVSSRSVSSGLRGMTQALYLLGSYSLSRYEFVFTNLNPHCKRHYVAVMGVHKAYNGSRMYRELKLRGATIHNKQLKMLPNETICLNEHSVWNLSSDTGNLGTLLVTNVRVVWFADVNEAFNVSLPYIVIESISVRSSKFGEALVIASHASSGGYVLGFRVDPPEKLRPLQRELSALHEAYTAKPMFGVTYNWDTYVSSPKTEDLEDFEEIGEPRGEMGSALYLASQAARSKTDEQPPQPVFSPYLGLAIEPLKEGFTLKGLFEVQTS